MVRISFVNARKEARERIGDRFDVRVLEPSPPAVDEPPWYADDPLGLEEAREPDKVVAPVEGVGLAWDDLVAEEPDLGPWCADRWLGARRRIELPPPSFEATRGALHSVAEHVLAAARHLACGKIGLRYTREGFGTPFFGAGMQVRVQGVHLVVDGGGYEERCALTTLGDAARLAGIECGLRAGLYEPATPSEVETELPVDEEAAHWLGDWFGFGASLLEQLRAEAAPEDDAARVQIWPEHFDMAVEIGNEERGQRVTLGLSPGDAGHSAPYIYALPWAPVSGDTWNAEHFDGSLMDVHEVTEAGDQRATALGFLRTARAALGSSERGATVE